jgi:hypothetical protein
VKQSVMKWDLTICPHHITPRILLKHSVAIMCVNLRDFFKPIK